MSPCANAAPHTSTLLRWLLLAVSFLAPVRALADESAPHLEWSARAVCPRPADADREIARLVGERYRATDKAVFFVEVTRNTANGFDLALRFRDEGEESARHMRLASCAEVQEAAILLAAMALQSGTDPDPADVSAGVEPTSPASEAAEADVEARGLAGEPSEAEASAKAGAKAGTEADAEALAEPVGEVRLTTPWLRTRDSLRLEIQLEFDAKSLPRVSAGPSIGLSVRVHPSVDLGLHGRYLLPREAGGSLPDQTRAQVDLFAAALEARLRLHRHPWVFGPSGEFELGALRGHASGTVESGRGNAVWASLSAGVYGLFPVHRRLDLAAKAHLTVPLQRPSFAFTHESHSFYTTAPVGFRLFFGVSCALGPTD